MSVRFKKIFNFEKNLWCKSSPVLIKNGALLEDTQLNKVLIQLKFLNLSSNIISQMLIKINYKNTLNDTSGSFDFSYLDLNAKKGDSFGDRIPVINPDKDAREFSFIITKIIFADNSVWANENIFVPIPKENTSLDSLGNLGEQYKRDLAPYAKGKIVIKNDYWYCSCGEFNISTEENCHHCGMNREMQLSATDENLLREHLDSYEKEMAEKKESELKKKEQLKKRKKILFTVAIIILAFVASVNFYKSYKTYKEEKHQELLLKEFNELTKIDEKVLPIDIFILTDMYGICGFWYEENSSKNSILIRFNDFASTSKLFIYHQKYNENDISIDKIFNISDFEINMIKFNQDGYDVCLKFKDNYTKIELIIYSDEGLYQYEFLKEGI